LDKSRRKDSPGKGKTKGGGWIAWLGLDGMGLAGNEKGTGSVRNVGTGHGQIAGKPRWGGCLASMRRHKGGDHRSTVGKMDLLEQAYTLSVYNRSLVCSRKKLSDCKKKLIEV